ncbi:hypothetical protein ES705_15415 [subsurface metagenome]
MSKILWKQTQFKREIMAVIHCGKHGDTIKELSIMSVFLNSWYALITQLRNSHWIISVFNRKK